MNDPSQPGMQAFRVGGFLVQPTLNRITGPAGQVQIEPRMMAVLVTLASRPGEVVSRKELLAVVWHDTVVNDETLTRAIFHLRRHFGDDSEHPRVIETIRKGGYRLVAAVSSVGNGLEQVPSSEPRRGENRAPAIARVRYRRSGGIAGAVIVLLAGLTVGVRQVLREPDVPGPPTVVALTSYPGDERQPSISPDGSLVAFTMTDPVSGVVDLYVKHTSSESLLRLTDDSGEETYSAWSPDGSRIAFAKRDDRGAGIYIISAIGGQPSRVLSSAEEISGVSWSPDGESLAYSAHADDGDPRAIHLLNLSSGTSVTLTTPPAWNVDWRPEVSPDGSTIAFVRADAAGNEDVWLVPADSGAARRITDGQIRVRGLAWEPDGDHLVFSSLAHGPFRLWRINVRTGERTWLAIPGEGTLEPAIAGRTGDLVYVESRIEASIWRTRTNGQGAPGRQHEPLIRSTAWEVEARYSPDGSRLAFTSSRSGSLEIWIADSDGQNPRRLTDFGGALVGTPRWSPDGRQIAFSASPAGNAAVYVVDEAGGTPRQLTDGSTNELPSSWARDGRWLYVASDRTGSWQIWRVRANGGPLQRITAEGGREAYEGADGAWLYVARPDRAGLWRLAVGSAEEGVADTTDALPRARMTPVLVDLPCSPGHDNWMVQDSHLYALNSGEDVATVVEVDLETGRRSRLGVLPGIASPTLAVSPDGAYAVYPRIDRSESDLRLLRGFRWRAEIR